MVFLQSVKMLLIYKKTFQDNLDAKKFVFALNLFTPGFSLYQRNIPFNNFLHSWNLNAKNKIGDNSAGETPIMCTFLFSFNSYPASNRCA